MEWNAYFGLVISDQVLDQCDKKYSGNANVLTNGSVDKCVWVQCTIVRMRVSRLLKSGPVRSSTWHRLEVWTSVEVFKSKC